MTESRVTQTLGREQRGTPGPRTPMPDLRSDAVSPKLRQGQRLASRGTPRPRPGHDSLRGYRLKDSFHDSCKR